MGTIRIYDLLEHTSIFIAEVLLIDEKNHEILTALHYKPLYNINCSEKWGKKYTSRGLKWHAYGIQP